jgi:hypothetical protein
MTLKPETIAVLVALGINVEWARRTLLGKRILAEAAQYHGVSLRTLLNGKEARTKRALQVSAMRFAAMAAMRMAGLATIEIAPIFRMSDHSSVCYGLRVVNSDPRLTAQAADLLDLATGQKQREAA